MNEHLRNNPSAIRACILYEFAAGKSAFETYKKLCERVGDNAIDYVDFEFWFMRFANGKFDLDYDRNLDPKTRSFSDMPIHIIEKIFNKLELMDRLIIGRVSKNLRNIIDNLDPGFNKIRFNMDDRSTYLNFITYKNLHCQETKNRVKLTIGDLAVILKNQKLQFDEFKVKSFYRKFCPAFESMLKSLDQKIHVKNFTYIANSYTINGVMTILPYLNAGTLEEIVLSNMNYPRNNEFKTIIAQLAALEQCRNAMLTWMCKGFFFRIPDKSRDFFESFLEFRRLTIVFNSDIFKKTVLQFTEIILKSTVLEIAILKECQINVPVFLRQLGRRAIKVPGRPNVRRLPIPDSNEFFEIKVNDDSIRIERTS